MARDYRYDVLRVFQRVPEIMGLDLTWHHDEWHGGYYIDGQPHAFRRDKLKVVKYQGSIWVHEEGGKSMNIVTWLVEHGGAEDKVQAFKILEGADLPLRVAPVCSAMESRVEYVPRFAYDGCAAFALSKCPLYRWMCGMFPEERVKAVWNNYRVTTDTQGLAVFWYSDAEGRICYDKRMRYLDDGHRDKAFGGSRSYRTADGFTARPMFGSHLLAEGVCRGVVESEKTALLASLYYGGTWLAAGGKGSLLAGQDVGLYPDLDGVEEWSHKGRVVEWWLGWSPTSEKSDMGDMIVDLVGRGIFPA